MFVRRVVDDKNVTGDRETGDFFFGVVVKVYTWNYFFFFY